MLSLRYQDIIPSLDMVFHIFGCGAIGSAAAIQLTRMGAYKFVLYDLDKIESHNIGVSNYSTQHIGEFKTTALKMQMKDISQDIEVQTINRKVDNSTIIYLSGNDIAIIGFDNMEARQDSVRALYKTTIKPRIIIDGRMGAEHYQQVTAKTMNEYMKTWYHDSEGDPEPCTAKATSYCSNFAGSMISNTVRKYVTQQPYSREFSFHFPTMMLDYKQQKC